MPMLDKSLMFLNLSSVTQFGPDVKLLKQSPYSVDSAEVWKLNTCNGKNGIKKKKLNLLIYPRLIKI
jgi:hypothetical protein